MAVTVPNSALRLERFVERRGGNPSAASAVSAIPCVIGAASALGARGRGYGNAQRVDHLKDHED
jgi:hypothetical protein